MFFADLKSCSNGNIVAILFRIATDGSGVTLNFLTNIFVYLMQLMRFYTTEK